jgi:hypothetical protein
VKGYELKGYEFAVWFREAMSDAVKGTAPVFIVGARGDESWGVGRVRWSESGRCWWIYPEALPSDFGYQGRHRKSAQTLAFEKFATAGVQRMPT